MNKPLLIKRLIFALALLLALQGLGAGRAIAQPALPSSFYGTVTYEGGSVSAGTKVSAWIDDVPYAETNVFLDGIQSVFAINVPADNPYTTEVETAEDTQGKAITFKVGTDKIKDITPTWQSGTNVRQDLAYYGNRLPEAEGQTLIVTAGVQVIITLHATDLDGDSITYYRTSDPLYGTFIFDYPPGLIYLPNSDFPGEDRFNFEACDLEGCDEAEVFMRTNVAPVLIPYSYITDEDIPLPIDLADFAIDADGDDLTWEILTPPINGSVDSVTLTYTPMKDFPFREEVGYDSFTIQVNDGFADSNVVTISITVNEVDDPPVAPDMNIEVYSNRPYTIELAGYDVDSSFALWHIETWPVNGRLDATDKTRKWIYTSNENYLGTDSFQYYLETTDEEPDLRSNIGTMYITVVEPPEADYFIFLPLILK